MTPEEVMCKLHADLAYWQRQLRLDDIDIQLRWLDKEEEEPDVDGQMDGALTNNKCLISIRNPEHRPILQKWQERFGEDYEVTLVHELLHVRDENWRCVEKMWKLQKDDTLNSLYERDIDAVAEALVRARRGIQR